MKIRTLWEHDGEPGHLPWLVGAVDEMTEEEHNGTPDFYQKELDTRPEKRRELVIAVPDEAVMKIFMAPTVVGKVLP